MKQEPLFYIERSEQNVAGPYDLVQMAGLLRKKIITVETLTRLEGEEDWKPFGEHPHYIIVLEIPADAVSMRVAALDEEARAPKGFIPLPSTEIMIKLWMGLGLLLIVAGLVYLIAKSDPVTGHVIAIIGAGVGMAAEIIIIAKIINRLFDEDYITQLMFFFVPFFDIYYFLSYIWDYLPYLCAKYIGVAIAAAAMAGIAASSSH